MGVLRQFFVEYVLSGLTKSLERKLDEIRSEYPTTLASGYYNWVAGSFSAAIILSIPVASASYSMAFHLRNIMINNTDGSGQYAFFYDGPGYSVSVGGIQVGASITEFIDGFQGWIFYSHVMASLRTSLTNIRVGGLIREASS